MLSNISSKQKANEKYRQNHKEYYKEYYKKYRQNHKIKSYSTIYKKRLDKLRDYIESELYEVGGMVHGSDLPYDEAIKPMFKIIEGEFDNE